MGERYLANPNFLFYGAGAIGSTLSGWLSEHYENVYVLARGENAEVMKSKGLTLYERDKAKSKTIPIKIITNINNLKQVDIIVITVKNYDLEEVANDIYQMIIA
jgi:2-dehydropantoate 2-reductase